MDITYCSKCGLVIWEWVKVCPECKANQEEWKEGEKVK